MKLVVIHGAAWTQYVNGKRVITVTPDVTDPTVTAPGLRAALEDFRLNADTWDANDAA